MADEPKPEGVEPAAGKPDPAQPAGEKPVAAKPAAPAKPPAAHAPPKPPPTMAATPWESELTKMLREQFGDQIAECSTYLGQNEFARRPLFVQPDQMPGPVIANHSRLGQFDSGKFFESLGIQRFRALGHEADLVALVD